MKRQTPRKTKYRSPDQQIKEQDERRAEIRQQARLQSTATGGDELAILEALLIQEAAERSRGDAERGLMIFDLELEMIQQDQARDGIESIIKIVQEIADEYLADSENYITAAQAEATV